MNMKRLMLVWVMFLCTVLFLCVVTAAEGLPTLPPTPSPAERTPVTQLPVPEYGTLPTQPPTPPASDPVTRTIVTEQGQLYDFYPFPTAVEGYTFVSFAGDPFVISLGDFTENDLIIRLVCRCLEKVYPGCCVEQLNDFVITSDSNYSSNSMFSRQAGIEGETRFAVLTFTHPMVYGANFNVLLSYGYQCAFFTERPYMAADLAAYECSPITREAALAMAWDAYAAACTAGGLPEPDDAARSDIRVRTDYIFSQNDDLRTWEIDFYRPQTPYDTGIDPAGIIFSLEADADTGEIYWQEFVPATLRDKMEQFAKNPGRTAIYPTMPPTPVPMVREDEPGDWDDWEPEWTELEHYRSGDFTVVVNGDALEIAEYLGTDTAVVIPMEIDGHPVTYIWPGAFDSNQEIVSVEIQARLTNLDATFCICGKLETVVLPDSLRVIGSEAFMGCHSLRKITIPEGVTTIGPEAFANCDALQTICLPESITVIDEFAFSTCTSLTSINIPNGVTTIGNKAFELCGNLTSISIPAGVTSIGRFTFERSDSLVITVAPGSHAETYCKDNWLTYVTTDE